MLRAKIGQQIFIFNENCGQWSAVLQKDYILPIAQVEFFLPSLYKVNLVLAQTSTQILKQLVRQATELGVHAMQFLKTEFCNHALKINFERLKKIALEASQQCERLDISRIESEILDLKYFLKNFPQNSSLIFCNEDLKGQKNQYNLSLSKNIFILIGPEGGFSNSEKELLQNFEHTISIALSRNILRVETAAVAVITKIMDYY